jgi:hypothetical protein
MFARLPQYGFVKSVGAHEDTSATVALFADGQVDLLSKEVSTPKTSFAELQEVRIIRGITKLFGVPSGTYAGQPAYHAITLTTTGDTQPQADTTLAVLSPALVIHKFNFCVGTLRGHFCSVQLQSGMCIDRNTRFGLILGIGKAERERFLIILVTVSVYRYIRIYYISRMNFILKSIREFICRRRPPACVTTIAANKQFGVQEHLRKYAPAQVG